tara:strand:+ start:2212 stop:4431 length:2220 start_codon:yes stop_codon:yes gene_type:complete
MLRLTLADHDIELYQNEPVNLSYQFSDVQNINSSASNFSQTFRVPLTGQNQEYFGAVNEIGLIPTWNPKTKVKAEISYNTVPIMRGFAQVKNIYIQKGRYADVELVVFGETADLSRDVGDGMLTDVNLSAFNHTLNAANIEASWAGTLSSGVIRYGIIDKWRNWRSGNIWTATEPLEHGDFTPYILTSKLFETILTEAGYTYDSNFFDSKVGELYMLMNRGNRLPIPVDADQPSANVFQVGLAADYSNGANTWTPIPGLSEAAPFYDAGGNVSSGAFTAPFEAFYTFRVLASGNINHTITTVSLRLSKNSSTEIFPIITNLPGAVFNEEVYVVTSDPILLNSGDVVRFDTIISDNAHTLTLYGNNSLSAGGTGFSVIEITEPTSGQMVDVAANLPVMKKIDFISGLQKMFNLVFIPDRNNSKHLYIETLGYYLSSGTKKDWTNKIDLSKDIQVEPTTDLQARTYEWTHSNGKDLVNDLVQKNASRTYGRYKVDDPENDFAAGEKRIKTAFAPHVVSYIPGTDYAIHRMLADTINADNTIKDPLPRLAFWNGLTTGVLYYLNDTSGTVTSTTYPMLSQFSASYPTVSDDDLSFGVERPFHRVQANPVNTLYYKYWMPWVNELYSSDARIVTAYFRLTASEMATFEFSDKIYIKDTYFRILSISNYDPTTENVVQVRLVKILGEIRDCYYIPVSSDKNGQISFSTPLGSIVTSPSPGCCERYGYVFDDSGLTSRCFQNLPQ